MSPDLRARLRDTDPARDAAPWPSSRQAEVVDMILSRDDVVTAPPTRRVGRRGAALATTTLLAAAAVTGAVVLPDRNPAPDPAAAGSAVRLELERLAARTSAAPTGYLYVKTSHRALEGTFVDAGAPLRDWSTEVVENWTGWTCDDRQRVVSGPIAFPTPADRQRWLAEDPPWAKDALTGGVQDTRGAELRALDDVPCDEVGTLGHPNPPYVATYPTTPEAFLAKVRADAAADPSSPGGPLGAQVMSVLETPWLTDAQRSAGLRALEGQLGDWRVAGHETVAGIDGVVLALDQADGTREEVVLAASAPGVLRRTTVLVDPARAAATTIRKAAGLPAGTALAQSVVTVVGTVPDTDALP